MSNVTALPIPGFDQPPAPGPAAAAAIVYESEFATVYHGHSETILPVMQTESFDLILTDPPYGVQNRSNRRAVKFDPIANDTPSDRPVVRGIIEQCIRLVRQQRHLYVFGPQDALDGMKVSEVVELIWDKGTLSSGDTSGRTAWGPSHERINFCVSKHRHAGKTGLPTNPGRVRRGTVLRYTRPTGTAVRHPDEKPWELCAELIESSSRPGETVLDPFAGVLSTAVAAILTGRRAVVMEADGKYVAVGIERIKKAEALARQMHQL